MIASHRASKLVASKTAPKARKDDLPGLGLPRVLYAEDKQLSMNIGRDSALDMKVRGLVLWLRQNPFC